MGEQSKDAKEGVCAGSEVCIQVCGGRKKGRVQEYMVCTYDGALRFGAVWCVVVAQKQVN